MIHYSCDCCKRSIDPQEELRYVVRLEVYAAMDPVEGEEVDDRDHLAEIQEILESMDDAQSDRIGDDVYQQLRFDLCPECRARLVENPLAREPAAQFGFSEN